MEEDTEDSNLFEENYYSFLNVSKEATSEEINSAYRQLSRIYHPDKHQDEAQKEQAKLLFNRTKRAYEVLSDPHKRAIYDTLGVRGLETDGWELVTRSRTPGEIRDEYERLASERAQRRLQQRTNPRGNVTVDVNATELFNHYEDVYRLNDVDKGFPVIEVSGMSIYQSIEAPLTLRDTVTMSGSLGTQNGTGSGSVNISTRRLLSENAWVEFDAGAGNGPTLGVKGYRTLTKRLFCNAASVFQFDPQGVTPNVVCTLAMQLDKYSVGYLTHRNGLQSSMSTIIIRNTEFGHYSLTMEVGLPHSYIGISYVKKMIEREIKLRIAMKIGTFGFLLEYGAEKKVSQQSCVSAAMSVGVPTGVTLKVKFCRASQVYMFPIHLCEEVIPSPIFYGTIVPLIGWFLLKKLVIEPIQMEQKEREIGKVRETNKSRILEQRKEAEAAVELMSATFARIRTEEESKLGLVITKALYGKLTQDVTYRFIDQNHNIRPETGSSRNRNTNNEILDVTIPVQCLVRDSKLILHESTKCQLPGFFDPCIGEPKSLLIQYLFHAHLHEVTISDTDTVRIPRQTHRVSTTL